MNKLNSNSPAFRQLIVLISGVDVDISSAARRVVELATAHGGRVQILGLYQDEEREPSLRRQMVTLSSMVGGGGIPVESKIESGNDWLELVESNWNEGDAILCIGEQQRGLIQRPLYEALERKLPATIYIFTEVREKPQPKWLASAFGWAGSLAIVALFFWGQVKLTAAQQDWRFAALLYLSIFAEAGSIWAWNSIFES
jgi:hypothetical protein